MNLLKTLFSAGSVERVEIKSEKPSKVNNRAKENLKNNRTYQSPSLSQNQLLRINQKDKHLRLNSKVNNRNP